MGDFIDHTSESERGRIRPDSCVPGVWAAVCLTEPSDREAGI